ncbi:MAG: ethanolamine utilization protein EutN [Elusimicrobia bacterium]|nr:ethanolamine utilization protein EutN [Elusimicrobiota bacterium]
MRLARVIGRVFCTRQVDTLDGKTMLLIQPLAWEDEAPRGDPIVALDAVGAGASEKVYWVAAREAAVAFRDLPPADAAVVGIVEGHQVRDFRGGSKG